jgi:hypothetical protein
MLVSSCVGPIAGNPFFSGVFGWRGSRRQEVGNDIRHVVVIPLPTKRAFPNEWEWNPPPAEGIDPLL